MLISCIDYIYILVLLLGAFNVFNLLFRMEPIKSFEAPTPIFSASLHPSKSCFVAGGDDFKLYKFDYEDGKELGKLIHVLHFQNLCAVKQADTLVECKVCRPKHWYTVVCWLMY